MTLFIDFDLPLERFLTSFVGKSENFDTVVYAIAKYDLFKGVVLFSLLWFAWFDRPGSEPPAKRDERREKLLVTVFATFLAVVFSRLMQHFLWVHPRPFVMDLGLTFPKQNDMWGDKIQNSFPSDHAVYFSALATGLWTINKRLGWFAFFWTFVVVCLPRVYLGVHHPSDVVAGCIFGILFVLALQRISWLQSPAKRTLAWGYEHQGTFYFLAYIFIVNATQLFDDIRRMGYAIVIYLKGAG